mgnify:CR=1 FL=1
MKQEAIPAKPIKKTRRDELYITLKKLNLLKHVQQLSEEGYCIVEDAIPPEMVKRLRDRVIEVGKDQLNKKRRSGQKFAQVGALFYKGRVFEEAVQLPKQVALAEYMLGANYSAWQFLASVRGEGTKGLPVHNDLGPGWRVPFQSFPEMCTSLYILDEFNQDAGSTFVVPRTHHLRRRPDIRNRKDRAYIEKHAIPIVAKPGSIAMWDARMWHGSLPRKLKGERVVLSYAATRVYFRPSDDYTELPEEVFERNDDFFARLVGRGIGYGELGIEAGVLFGGARDANKTGAWINEEENLSLLDTDKRLKTASVKFKPEGMDP